MASATEAICLSVLLFLLQLFFPLVLTTPTPTPWPHQFHSLQIWNTSGSLQINNLWYDWPKGRNMNLVQYQLGKLLYNLEWNNGTSFYYTLHPINHYCHVRHFDIGILRPNFLHDANYLGQQYVDNFLCNVWEKVDFIWYYEDVLTRLPVRWIFYTGMIVDVITFEAGVVLEDEHWQAPVYCFSEEDEVQNSSGNPLSLSLESMREIAHPAYAK